MGSGLAGVGTRIDTLFYEIDAHTSGFEQSMGGAKGKLTEFITYAKGNPAVVLAAVALAFVGIGVAATKMAADIDESMRRTSKSFPLTQEGAEKLRGTLEELSRITPRSQAELAGALEAIAKNGVDSIEEMQFRLRKAVDIADASGAELGAVIEGLDNIADAFKLSSGEAADELTRIFAAAQGKVPLEQVFAVLERGGSVLASLKVNASEAGEAMVALIDAGIPRRQAGTVLQTILEARGQAEKLAISGTEEQKKAAKIVMDNLSSTSIVANGFTKSLANLGEAAVKSNVSLRDVGINTAELNAINRVGEAAARDNRTEQQKLADAYAKLKLAAETGRSGAAALSQFLKNELNAVLIDLGNTILPVVIAGLKTMKGILDGLHAPSALAEEIKLIEAQERLANAQKGLSRAGISEAHALKSMPSFNEGTLSEQELGRFGTAQTDYLQAAKDVSVLEEALRRASQARGDERRVNAEIAGDRKKQEEEDAARDRLREAREKESAIRQQTQAMVDSIRIEALQARANATKTLVDDAEAQVSAFEQKLKNITDKKGKPGEDALAELERLRANVGIVKEKEMQAAADRLNAIVDENTITQVDNLTHALDQLKRELAEVPGVTKENIDSITEMKKAVIAATKASEEAAISASVINVDSPQNGIQKMKQLQGIQDTLTTAQAKTKEGSAAWKIYDEAIKGVITRIKALQDANEGLADPVKENTARIREMARTIQEGVEGALQLAEAFGLVDSNTAKLLGSISQIATGIGPLKDAIGVMQAGGSALPVIGAALPIAGALAGIVSGLFGKSPEEIERQRLMKENNAVLRDLNKNIGDLARINVTGTELSQFEKFLNDPRIKAIGPQQGLQGILPTSVHNQIGAVLDAMKMSFEELREFAKQFGLDFGNQVSVAELNQLREAMAAAEITKFAESFAGQMQKMQAEIALFDLSKPIDQFNALRKALNGIAGGGGLIAKTMEEFDLTTSEGLRKAQEALQALFRQMQEGTLTATDLGGLTPQEFLDTILRIQELLKSQGSAAGLTGTGGFNVSREITEVTGSRMAALLASGNFYAEQTALNTALIASVLSGKEIPFSVFPPSIGGGSTSGQGGVTLHIEQFTVTVALGNSLLGEGDARRIGQEIATNTMDAIDTELAARLARERRANGVRRMT